MLAAAVELVVYLAFPEALEVPVVEVLAALAVQMQVLQELPIQAAEAAVLITLLLALEALELLLFLMPALNNSLVEQLPLLVETQYTPSLVQDL